MTKITLDLTDINPSIPKHIVDFDPSYVTRYMITSELIKAIGKRNKKLKILDVGGYNGAISNFLSEHDITIVDILEDEHKTKNYVQTNGADMPFEDDSFDVVVSCDALEHVIQPDRDNFIKEMVRVSKDYVVLCAPFGTSGVVAAEALVDSFHQGMTGKSYIWLKEHKEYILPQKTWLKNLFEKNKMKVASFSHTSLDLWILMLWGNFFLAGNVDAVDRKLAANLRRSNEDYLKNLAFKDFPAEGYRTFFIASKSNDIEVKLPVFNKTEIAAFMQKDAKSIGKTFSRMTQVMGMSRHFEKQNQDLVEQLSLSRQAEGELNAIKNSQKYKLVKRIASMRHVGRRG